MVDFFNTSNPELCYYLKIRFLASLLNVIIHEEENKIFY